MKRSEFLSYYVISTNPLIIYGGKSMHDLMDMSSILKDRNLYFMKSFFWEFESEERAMLLKKQHNEHREKYPNHKIVYLCNSQLQYDLFGKFGLLPRIFCNKNCLIDEKLFRILPNVKKRYKALYNAQIASYKRHHLASKIDSLALITYRRGGFPKHDEYIDETKKILSHATWLNGTLGENFKLIPPGRIHIYLNQAKIGLCLSAVEGQASASMEYMLCGLPIVSTKSKGGRDVFFDEKYVKIVDDTPEAVRDGVKEMIERNISPNYVRKKTLEKVRIHRDRFIDLVQGIYDKEGVKRKFRKEWHKIFINKMRLCVRFPGPLLRYVEKGMPVRKLAKLVSEIIQ
jgi:hypothetical protein